MGIPTFFTFSWSQGDRHRVREDFAALTGGQAPCEVLFSTGRSACFPLTRPIHLLSEKHTGDSLTGPRLVVREHHRLLNTTGTPLDIPIIRSFVIDFINTLLMSQQLLLHKGLC